MGNNVKKNNNKKRKKKKPNNINGIRNSQVVTNNQNNNQKPVIEKTKSPKVEAQKKEIVSENRTNKTKPNPNKKEEVNANNKPKQNRNQNNQKNKNYQKGKIVNKPNAKKTNNTSKNKPNQNKKPEVKKSVEIITPEPKVNEINIKTAKINEVVLPPSETEIIEKESAIVITEITKTTIEEPSIEKEVKPEKETAPKKQESKIDLKPEAIELVKKIVKTKLESQISENEKKSQEKVKDQKSSKKELRKKKKTAKIVKLIVFTLIFFIVCVSGSFLYIIFGSKFKNVTIELGTNEVALKDFLINKKNLKEATLKTNLAELDLTKVAEYKIVLTYKGKEEIVKLKIKDTKAPVVTFQNITKASGYELKAEDFLIDKTDLSEMTVTASLKETISEYKDYTVIVTVTDASGNKTSKPCKLTITWLISSLTIELGSKFSKENIILNMEKDADKIADSEIAKVDPLKLGEYTIIAIYEGKEYASIITVQDTTPPELELKDVTLLVGEKVKGKESFIKSVSDASGEVTTSLLTEIDYSKTGIQEITIEAIDKNGNKVEKKSSLTIKKDSNGPVISGATDLKVEKNATVDYYKGIKAIDAKDGEREVTVDTSKVNLGAAGTYYATYSSIDSEGNRTTVKRKIIVKHNQDDTNAKFDEFYDKYLAGKSVAEMTTVVRNKMGYNHSWGDDDPVWYGLTNNTGNCYVHAMILKKALDKAGITNILIHVVNKSHYWNLVEIDGVWRHYDSTPGSHLKGPVTDDQKFSSSAMGGRNWDRTIFPKAE